MENICSTRNCGFEIWYDDSSLLEYDSCTFAYKCQNFAAACCLASQGSLEEWPWTAAKMRESNPSDVLVPMYQYMASYPTTDFFASTAQIHMSYSGVFYEIGCKDERWIQLAQDPLFVIAGPNFMRVQPVTPFFNVLVWFLSWNLFSNDLAATYRFKSRAILKHYSFIIWAMKKFEVVL